MTTLPPLTEREQIGIDSFERAIAYSAHLLYSSFSQVSDYSKDFTITPNVTSELITIRVEFPVNYGTFWRSNANFIIGADNFSTATIEYLGQYLPPSNGDFISIPSNIDTLERYFIFCVVEFRNYLLANYPDLATNCIYTFNEKKRTISVKVILPYDPDIYSDYLDLLLAIKNWKDLQGGNNDNLPFGDEIQLTDDLQLTD